MNANASNKPFGDAPPQQEPYASALSHPAGVIDRLEAIEGELAKAQNSFEAAAKAWFGKRADRAKAGAEAYVSAGGTEEKRRLARKQAEMDTAWEQEAAFEIAKMKCKTLADRAIIGESILRSQSRV